MESEDGTQMEAETVIIATGATAKRMNLPGEDVRCSPTCPHLYFHGLVFRMEEWGGINALPTFLNFTTPTPTSNS